MASVSGVGALGANLGGTALLQSSGAGKAFRVLAVMLFVSAGLLTAVAWQCSEHGEAGGAGAIELSATQVALDEAFGDDEVLEAAAASL